MAIGSTAEGAASSAARISTDGGVSANTDPQGDSGQTGSPVDSIIGAADDGIVHELGHDDFDPVGTLVLVLIYMTILIGMWMFMYSVEFLGRDLTAVG